MAMPYSPIIATLAYVLSPDGKKCLMVHRNSRPDDEQLGKYNGLGGKIERDEDLIASLRRELREEASIECEKIILRGTISWPGFGRNGEDWFGFVFLVTSFTGTVPSQNVEGTLSWIDVDQIEKLPMWEGDHYFLPLVFGNDSRQFHGVMPYANGKPVSWNFSWI